MVVKEAVSALPKVPMEGDSGGDVCDYELVEATTLLAEETSVKVKAEQFQETGKEKEGLEICNLPSIWQRLKAWFTRAAKVYTDNCVLLVVTAVFAVSLNSTCIKVLSAHVSVFQIVAVRATLSVLFLVLLSSWMGFSLVGPREKLHLIHLRGLLGSSSFLSVAIATSLLPLSEAAFLANSYPVVTAFVAWMVGMEHLGILSWLGVCGCLAGNALVAHPPFLFGGHEEWGMQRVAGLVLAAYGNISLAVTFLIIAHLGKSVHGLTLTFYMQVYSVIECIPFLIAGYPAPVNLNHSLLELLCYAGVTCCGIPLQVVIQRAFQLGSPTKVTSLLMTNMLLSGVIGVVLLSEHMSWLSGIGSLVIIVSVLLVILQRQERLEPYKAVPTVDVDAMKAIEMPKAQSCT